MKIKQLLVTVRKDLELRNSRLVKNMTRLMLNSLQVQIVLLQAASKELLGDNNFLYLQTND